MSLRKNKRKHETNEEFIQKWQERECLWNVRNSSYHNRASREVARKELAANCGMTGKVLLVHLIKLVESCYNPRSTVKIMTNSNELLHMYVLNSRYHLF